MSVVVGAMMRHAYFRVVRGHSAAGAASPNPTDGHLGTFASSLPQITSYYLFAPVNTRGAQQGLKCTRPGLSHNTSGRFPPAHSDAGGIPIEALIPPLNVSLNAPCYARNSNAKIHAVRPSPPRTRLCQLTIGRVLTHKAATPFGRQGQEPRPNRSRAHPSWRGIGGPKGIRFARHSKQKSHVVTEESLDSGNLRHGSNTDSNLNRS